MFLSGTTYENLEWGEVVIRNRTVVYDVETRLALSSGANFGTQMPIVDKAIIEFSGDNNTGNPLVHFDSSSSVYWGEVRFRQTGSVAIFQFDFTTTIELSGNLDFYGTINSSNNNDIFIDANGFNVNIDFLTLTGGSTWRLFINDLGAGSTINSDVLIDGRVAINYDNDILVQPPFSFTEISASGGSYSFTAGSRASYRLTESPFTTATNAINLYPFAPNGWSLDFLSMNTVGGFTSVYTGNNNGSYNFYINGLDSGSATFNLPKSGNDYYKFVKLSGRWNVINLSPVDSSNDDANIPIDTTGTNIPTVLPKSGETHVISSYNGTIRTNVTPDMDGEVTFNATINIGVVGIPARAPNLVTPTGGNWIINGVDCSSSSYFTSICENILVIIAASGDRNYLYINEEYEEYDTTWRNFSSTTLQTENILIDDRIVASTYWSTLFPTAWQLPSDASATGQQFEFVVNPNSAVLPTLNTNLVDVIFVNGTNEGTTWQAEFAGQHIKGVKIGTEWYLDVSLNPASVALSASVDENITGVWDYQNGLSANGFSFGQEVANIGNLPTAIHKNVINNFEYIIGVFETISNNFTVGDSLLVLSADAQASLPTGAKINSYSPIQQLTTNEWNNSQRFSLENNGGDIIANRTSVIESASSSTINSKVEDFAAINENTGQAERYFEVTYDDGGAQTNVGVFATADATDSNLSLEADRIVVSVQTDSMAGGNPDDYIATKKFTEDTQLNNIQTVSTATEDIVVSQNNICHVTHTTTGNVTLQFLTADITNGDNWQVVIKDAGANAATNNITIITQGSETIDGAANLVISTNNGSVTVYTDGTNLFTY